MNQPAFLLPLEFPCPTSSPGRPWFAFCLFLALFVPLGATAATRFVNAASATPATPFASWATAARTIQDAVDSALAGDEIVVTNGVYAEGGHPVSGTLSNRVAITKPVTVRSVNGPAETRIEGYRRPDWWIHDESVRCVHLASGGMLIGFTLTNGSVRDYSDVYEGQGGGVWCESPSAIVSNCVFAGNAAFAGGGAWGGTLLDCLLATNTAAQYGGGVFASQVERSSLVGNAAGGHGGGAAGSTLRRCTLVGNSGYSGGGAHESTLTQCTLLTNWAYSLYGGGAYACSLVGSTLIGNTAPLEGGGTSECKATNCAFVANSAASGGGAFHGSLVNCTLVGNSAANGGGAYWAYLYNCIVVSNRLTGSGTGPNYFAGELNYSCASPLPPTGSGNIAVDPQLSDRFHLSVRSPCRTAGNAAWAIATDIDGDSWFDPPSIGCDEFQPPVLFPPSIVLQPNGQSILDGASAYFSANAEAEPLPVYFLLLDGRHVRGPTRSPSFTITNVSFADAGDYTVLASNQLGTASSLTARLEVVPTPPTILLQPHDQSMSTGYPATFSVVASGTAPISFQWYREDSSILDATNSTLVVTNVQLADAGSYHVVVSNRVSVVRSDEARLTVVERRDFFTKTVPLSGSSLGFQQFTFTPDDGPNAYTVCRRAVSQFPTDPTNGMVARLDDDSFSEVTLTNGSTVSIYGRRTGTFFIGSNGYLTFDSGDWTYAATANAHFRQRRVSALFTDLIPRSTSKVSWKQLSDRVAVTYEHVRENETSNDNSFQIELFFDGRIRLTYLRIDSRFYMAGLSAGTGVPIDFRPSDFFAYDGCSTNLLVIDDVEIMEGDAGTVELEFVGVLTADHSDTISVDYTTVDGTATATNDYLPVSGRLIFGPGETNKIIRVTVLGELSPEFNETFVLRLSHATNAYLQRTRATAAILDDDSPLTIVHQPTHQVVRAGTNVSLRVVAFGGVPPIRYQWSFNGTNLSGATNAILEISNVQLDHDGTYSVLLADALTSLQSEPVRLTVRAPPRMIEPVPPVQLVAVAGDTVVLSASFVGGGPYFVRWRRSPPAGGATPIVADHLLDGDAGFLTLANVTTNDAGIYVLNVTNTAGGTLGLSGKQTNAVLTVLTDADGDALPDSWEIEHRLNPADPSDGHVDSDDDGVGNRDEFLAGTDPRDPRSHLKVEAIESRDGGSGVRLRFLAAGGRTYTVQWRNAVAGSNSWERLADIIAAAGDRMVEVTDPNESTGSAVRFYRLSTPRSP